MDYTIAHLMDFISNCAALITFICVPFFAFNLVRYQLSWVRYRYRLRRGSGGPLPRRFPVITVISFVALVVVQSVAGIVVEVAAKRELKSYLNDVEVVQVSMNGTI